MPRRVSLLVSAGAVAALVAGCSSASGGGHPTGSPAVGTAPASSSAPTREPSGGATTNSAPKRTRTARPSPTASRGPTATRTRSTRRASGLPLHSRTGQARQVITVVAGSTHDTTATLQAWRRVDGGWRRHGGAVHAWLGSDGLSAHPSESRSATPIGSFTLTQAFGHDPDPGTRLPYVHTDPSDWWISQPGRLYNTMQDCSSDCAFSQGDPNEHLFYETPFYDYAVVIDYNTRDAPGGVRQGAGSAFFLHVTVHAPTQGCISIPKRRLVALLRWLSPAAHPRILIGAG